MEVRRPQCLSELPIVADDIVGAALADLSDDDLARVVHAAEVLWVRDDPVLAEKILRNVPPHRRGIAVPEDVWRPLAFGRSHAAFFRAVLRHLAQSTQ